MLAITQFEVHVLQKGRWTIHARYPGEERNQAIQDARATEAGTGFATKVIRETYFPEVNESERITVYASPKAKEQDKPLLAKQRRKPLASVARAATGVVTRRNRQTVARQPLTASQMFFRVIVAGGFSLAAATLMTGVLVLTLNLFASSGVELAPDTRTMLLTYAYILMFLFFFLSLFRSRLPLHPLLAELWQKASKAATPSVVALNDGKPPRVRPKHERAPSPETLREWEDLKVKRGDLDPLKLQEMAGPPPVAAPAPAEPPPIGDVPPPPEVAKADAKKAEAEKAAAKKAADAKKKDDDAKKEDAKQKEDLAPAPAAPTETAPDTLNLERMVLRRFAVDVVKPAIMSSMPDDPVARRGAAVVLAGGAAGVAATAQLTPAGEMELLTDVLHHIGMTQGAIDSFMSQHDQQTTAPANAGLLGAGRSALAAYLEGGVNISAVLARVLTSWRTPMGQNNLPDQAFGGGDINAVPLLDVYMMTELREDARFEKNETAVEALHDQAMGMHNGVVRAAITAHGGHEVKHTGKGIFARFASAREAVDAAVDMQRAFTEIGSKLAIGLVGNNTAGNDPILSANLVHQAQAVVARTGAGEILCEAQVQAAVRRQRGITETGDLDHVSEELDLVRLGTAAPDFEAPKHNAGAGSVSL